MADREPFIKATEDLLGKENCAWMLAWKPLQDASAFRLYCKGIGKDIKEYDEVAKNLEKYENDKKWKPIIDESKRFKGVIESVSESPCSELLYFKPVNRELGLVRTSAGKHCCLLDGYNCDKYKYLKNDYLSVLVWSIIRNTCNLAGIPIPTIRELDNLLDDKTFDIYSKGLTCTINQADSDFATNLIKRYKPRSVAEMSAFVAIIRPGCASLLQDFIDRKPYTTGVAELDDILKEGNHRMIYQELIMRYLIWLGIPETGSYDVIKKIAKKKFKEPELKALNEKLLKGWIDHIGSEEGFNETWQVVQDAARYSFNACVSSGTVIQRVGFRMDEDKTVAQLYKDFRRGQDYGYALSMDSFGRLRKNKIVDIRKSGVQKIYRVKTKSGAYLDCTMNHRFPTPDGKKYLSELKVGDYLYVKSRELFPNIYNTELSKISSIKCLAKDLTYDVEMKAPYHTFMTKSGLVTSNSHSLSYAYDSLYCAYLKSHYPLEYYTVALNSYADDEKRTLKLTEELAEFNIKLKPIQFRYSRSGYTLSREDNSIYKGIQSIKNMNGKVADEIYELGKNSYKNFLELLKDIKEKTSTKTNQLQILMKLNFFSEFGSVNKILALNRFFEKFYGLTQIKKKDLEEFGVDPILVQQYAQKTTAKILYNVDFDELAGVAEPLIPYSTETELQTMIEAQSEFLGYITIKDEKYKRMVVVLSVDTKFSPRLQLYSLKNGTTLECKISKNVYKKLPLKEGNIIKILGSSVKPKMKKCANGFEPIPNTAERWITKYCLINSL